jgi:hypothetical protein
MKIDATTISVLENFQLINPSLYFREGNILKTMSKTQNVYARAVVPFSFPMDFAIYDLNKLLRILSIFKDAEIEFSDRYLTIIEGNRKTQYGYCDPDNIIFPEKSPERFPPDAIIQEFVLKPDMLTQTLRAMSVLQHQGVSFVGESGSLLMKTLNTKGTADAFTLQIGETDREFEFMFEPEKLAIIPMEYHVSLSKKKFANFHSENIDYWIAASLKSTIDV